MIFETRMTRKHTDFADGYVVGGDNSACSVISVQSVIQDDFRNANAANLCGFRKEYVTGGKYSRVS